MKRLRIIYNPTSGRELFKKQLPDVLDRFERAGYEASCHATKGAGDATFAAMEAARRGFDVIVAAGGDGTINEVVNGLGQVDERPLLGIIPVGTTNDFARALNIRSIDEAVSVICDGHTIPVDLGQVNDKFFINIAGGGRITELTYEVPSKLKTMLGQLAYYLKGIEMLPSIKASHVRIEYDDNVFDGEAMLFLVSNTNSVGGFEKLAPDASMSDGKFDLLILRKISLPEFIRVATLALRGEHLNDRRIIYAQASHIKVATEDHVQLNLDGEYGGTLPGEFRSLFHYLTVFAPKN